MNSNKPVGVNNNYISSRDVVITPTLISAASRSDTTRELYLSESTLMDLAISAAPQSNTLATNSSSLETILQQLQFRLFESNIASANFELKRVNALNPQTNSLAGVRDKSAQTLSFSLSSRSEDNGIIDGTVEYQIMISNIVPVDAARNTSAHLIMDASKADAIIF